MCDNEERNVPETSELVRVLFQDLDKIVRSFIKPSHTFSQYLAVEPCSPKKEDFRAMLLTVIILRSITAAADVEVLFYVFFRLIRILGGGMTACQRCSEARIF